MLTPVQGNFVQIREDCSHYRECDPLGKERLFSLSENGLDVVGIITTPVSFSQVTARHLTSNMHQLDRVDFTVHWCVENSWPIAISVHANKTWYFNWKEGENTDVRSRLRP